MRGIRKAGLGLSLAFCSAAAWAQSPAPAVTLGPIRVVGDETRLKQVFQNLISNAVKFMDKPRGLVTISWEALEEEGALWRFCVADNGPGIEARHHERIFEIFQTLSPRDDPESTGIGLTVVKKIIELAGGRIWVESEMGKGTRFMFTLPRRAVAVGAADAVVIDAGGGSA